MPDPTLVPGSVRLPSHFKSAEASFNDGHTYSKAPEASTKRMIDMQIMGNDFANGYKIDMTSESYLKELIKRASSARFSVNQAVFSFSLSRVAGKVSSTRGFATIMPIVLFTPTNQPPPARSATDPSSIITI